MEDLKKARLETEQARRDAGLSDGDAGASRDKASGPMDLLAKGKGKAPDSGVGAEELPPSVAAPKITGRGIDKRKHELEERRKALDAKRRKTGGTSNHPPSAGTEPSAPAAQPPRPPPTSPRTAKAKEQKPSAPNAADDFLAQLEADLRKG